MPEGDTIWRTAARLRPALVGERVESFVAPRLIHSPDPDVEVVSVEARGKYLLVEFSDGRVLETHMMMTGSWHLYRRGERWRRARSTAMVSLPWANGWQAVCFRAPRVRLLEPGRDGSTSGLGPDLTSPAPDLDAAVDAMARISPDRPLAEVLLDQRICCGVGNVYKSELLHALELDPDLPASALDQDQRRAIVELAHSLLRANLGWGRRRTVPDKVQPGGLAVYGRAGESCWRCGGRITSGVHGDQARRTYWCPGCQGRSGAARP